VQLRDDDLKQVYAAESTTPAGAQQAIAFARCQALCGLAQLSIEHGRAAASTNERSQRLNDANGFLTTAQKISPSEQIVQLGKGLALLAADNPTAAKGAFTNAKKLQCNGRKCLAAHMALAQLTFQEGDYRRALALFAEVLAAAPPAGRTAARAAVGACYVKLGEFAAARAAFERALSLDSGCAHALAGLAAVELLAPERTTVATGVALLCEAHARDPAAAGVCAALAACHLLRGEPHEAEGLAEAAVRRLRGTCCLAGGSVARQSSGFRIFFHVRYTAVTLQLVTLHLRLQQGGHEPDNAPLVYGPADAASLRAAGRERGGQGDVCACAVRAWPCAPRAGRPQRRARALPAQH
jgi:tetratricopeptide (TPR) repeat protein